MGGVEEAVQVLLGSATPDEVLHLSVRPAKAALTPIQATPDAP
jgi:hypothetical protein